jgi:hypothetical protein
VVLLYHFEFIQFIVFLQVFVETLGILEVLRDEHFEVGEIDDLTHAENVRIAIGRTLGKSALLAIEGLVLIIFHEVFVILSDVLGHACVLGHDRDQRQQALTSKGLIVFLTESQFLCQSFGDGLHFEILVGEDEHFILLVAFEHGDVLHFSIAPQVVFVEFEAWR